MTDKEETWEEYRRRIYGLTTEEKEKEKRMHAHARTKQLCDHPENYGKECSEENCPDKNEYGKTAYEINMFYASWNCDYGRIDCSECGKNVGEKKGSWISSSKFVCNECAEKVIVK